VRVSTRITGPLLTVSNLYMGSVVTTSCSTPLSILDVPSGIELSFRFTANAQSYGGLVSGYRYGWDIADLNDPDQWEVDYTPFVGPSDTSPLLFFGTHTLSTEVIDDRFCSHRDQVNVVQFTLERNVLIVDDFRVDEQEPAFPGWDNPLGRGILPNDAEHDAFWLDMVSNVASFDPVSDVVPLTATSEVPLALLARYKTVLWSVYGNVDQRTDYPLLYPFIRYRKQTAFVTSGKVQPNYLALAMATGVHIASQPASISWWKAETPECQTPDHLK
jgi:hypothetical protein